MPDPHPKPAARCPICTKPSTLRDRPFCSPRCAAIDLGRWFGETYRIPGPPNPDTDDEITG